MKQTAKEDLKIIQPMLTAIRKNDFKAMYKYEDLMINLDDLMINHKKGAEYEGNIKSAMRDRLNSIEYLRKDKIESIRIELTALGIFNALNIKEIKKIVEDVVNENPIDLIESELKRIAIQKAMDMNQIRLNKEEVKGKNVSDMSLVNIRLKALKNKIHPYEELKKNAFICSPLNEFY